MGFIFIKEIEPCLFEIRNIYVASYVKFLNPAILVDKTK